MGVRGKKLMGMRGGKGGHVSERMRWRVIRMRKKMKVLQYI